MKTNKKDWVIGVGICVLLLLVFIPVTGLAVPGVINYQGYLTDPGGSPLNGDVAITFRIWSAEVAGTEVWSESHAVVEVSDGVFNVLLGSSVPIGAGILEGNRWLGMAVGADPEMTPRMKMTSVAYAIRAGYAESVAAGSVNTSALSDTAVTEAKIASGAVTSGKLGSGSVTSDKVASGGVSSEKIASGAVTGAKVAAGTLTASHLQDGAALAEILDDDGPGSGLNADLLDNYDSSAFSLAGHNHDAAYVNASGDSMDGSTDQTVLSVTNAGNGTGVSGISLGASGGRAVYGNASNTAHVTNYGGYFEAGGATGRGVWGKASGSDGIGVLASASGAYGTGVWGEATNNGDVTNYGGLFRAHGTTGRGVYGWATNAGNVTNYGGYFRANGSDGIGVYGIANNDGNVENYGGYFEANGYYGRGVYGGSSGTNGCGVQASARGSAGRGVYGEASGRDGVGIYGSAKTENPEEGVQNFGGYFLADGTNGQGVYGEATNTGNVQNYGGYFIAEGQGGRGVYGKASNADGVYNWGGYFIAYGASGVGVYGHAEHDGNVTNYGGSFSALGNSGRGVRGWGRAYDFYAAGPGTNYGAFTGGHEVKLSEDFPGVTKPGMIVSVTGQTQLRQKEDGTPSLSSTLPTVKLSTKVADKAVFGVLVAEMPLSEDHWYETKEGERFATVNALGEGRVWVSNINGEIEVGDYITTSSIPGYGQRQDDDLLHSYTLGKAIEVVDWPSVQENVLIGDREIKVYLIAVTYTSG